MTQKDESPKASEGPYWSEELLAVLVVGLGDETQARETLEGIIQQALSGRALQGISLRRGLGVIPEANRGLYLREWQLTSQAQDLVAASFQRAREAEGGGRAARFSLP